ncbi:hypothetical protein NZ698_18530 [Chryseobacterium sp. PBS4-4]|uniref:Uncharacterized protein n=1 Tax=Chryseobacterium edaphi TaxID=2976532 RepID=A0ABT2WAD5_9FLAO|nr:hypothetical protein [Chryseobacterium edaphi]MCU7619180.1 hypothetical protein [Chryseobacterium edaphi]
MKSIVLPILFLFCSRLPGQEKSGLLIGIYEKAKRGICSDYGYETQEVQDYADFVIKKTEFQKKHINTSRIAFVENKESVLIYRYEKKISGWNCSSDVVSFKTGKSMEECQKQLSDQLAKNPGDFTTDPKTLYSWSGKAEDRSVYTKDFGGIKASMLSADTKTKSIILAKFKNTTINQTAYIQVITDQNVEFQEIVEPGITLTKKYDAKTMEVSILYQKSNLPKKPFNPVGFVKSKLREKFTNGKNKIESKSMTAVGIRG